MKRNKSVFALLVLLAFGLSILHGFVIAKHESSCIHNDVTHFVHEFAEPDPDLYDTNDLCNAHFIYHLPYIISETPTLLLVHADYDIFAGNPSLTPLQVSLTFLKPPIA